VVPPEEEPVREGNWRLEVNQLDFLAYVFPSPFPSIRVFVLSRFPREIPRPVFALPSLPPQKLPCVCWSPPPASPSPLAPAMATTRHSTLRGCRSRKPTVTSARALSCGTREAVVGGVSVCGRVWAMSIHPALYIAAPPASSRCPAGSLPSTTPPRPKSGLERLRSVPRQINIKQKFIHQQWSTVPPFAAPHGASASTGVWSSVHVNDGIHSPTNNPVLKSYGILIHERLGSSTRSSGIATTKFVRLFAQIPE
jgi:hypothetical protein